MSKYYCEFPYCDYSTENRSQIHYHHIVPVEFKGSNKPFNRLYLCPNCHNRIYIPNSTGQHSTQFDNSIIVNHKLMSTNGLVLEYIECDEVKYYFYSSPLKNLS